MNSIKLLKDYYYNNKLLLRKEQSELIVGFIYRETLTNCFLFP